MLVINVEIVKLAVAGFDNPNLFTNAIYMHILILLLMTSSKEIFEANIATSY